MKKKWTTLKEHIRYQLDRAEQDLWFIILFVSIVITAIGIIALTYI